MSQESQNLKLTKSPTGPIPIQASLDSGVARSNLEDPGDESVDNTDCGKPLIRETLDSEQLRNTFHLRKSPLGKSVTLETTAEQHYYVSGIKRSTFRLNNRNSRASRFNMTVIHNQNNNGMDYSSLDHNNTTMHAARQPLSPLTENENLNNPS